MQNKEVKLEEIADGVPGKLLAYELQKVLDNIADPNTIANKKRKVVLTFEIQPNEDRGLAAVNIFVESTLAKVKGFSTVIHFANTGDEIKAYEYDTKQPLIPGIIEDENNPKITNIEEAR